jgi:nucleotide-binding universal stress UspA family protein
MGPILAAVDFSDATPGVINTARDLARTFSVKLYLLHVATGSKPDTAEHGINPRSNRQLAAEAFRREHRELQALAAPLQSACPPQVTPLLIQGLPGEKILQESRRLDAGMIVMGTHGHGKLYDLLMGTVSREVLQSAFCPVVMVPYQLQTLG